MSLTKQARNKAMNLGSLVKSAEDMEMITGLDDDQMRDDVAMLSALHPKEYVMFRNNQLYGTKMDGSDDPTDPNYNPLKKYEADDSNKNFKESIKGKLKIYYNKAIKHLNDGNITKITSTDLITGQLPPKSVLSRLPKSKVRMILNEAYQNAWLEQKRNFEEIFPRKMPQKKTDSDGFEINL